MTAAEKYAKFISILDSILIDAVESRTRTVHLPPTDAARRWITLEYVQLHYRFDAETVKEGDTVPVVIHFVPGQTRQPFPVLSSVVEMVPSQALKYTIDFKEDGPRIHLYDIARGRSSSERINKLLRTWLGSYRTKRGESGFDMFLDFVDPNKAVSAYRRLVEAGEQCRLVNVQLFEREEVGQGDERIVVQEVVENSAVDQGEETALEYLD